MPFESRLCLLVVELVWICVCIVFSLDEIGIKKRNSTSIIEVDFQKEPRQIHSGLEQFKRLTTTKLFVDKTLLIREVFGHKSLVVTAPRYFGKSVNLNMLRLFLSNTQNKTEVVSAFQGTKVWSHSTFVQKHASSYPVLFCSFHTVSEVICLKSLTNFFRIILLKLFYEHFYLNLSRKLNTDQKHLFGSYIKNNKNLTLAQLANGLSILAEYMCLHHGKQTVVLIDDYDELILNNLFDPHYKGKYIEKEQFEITSHLITFHQHLLCCLIRDRKHIERVIMTGILSLDLCPEVDRIILENVGFTQNDRFSVYYGYTKEEVLELIFKFGLNRDERIELMHWYSEYRSLNGQVQVYNPLSIAEFIMSRVGDSYWTDTKPFRMLGILPLLEHPKIFQTLVHLSNKTDVELRFLSMFTLHDLEALKSTTENWWSEATDTDLFFLLLHELGYLTFSPTAESLFGSKVRLRIPNEEIRKEIITFLHEFCDLVLIRRPDILETDS